MSELCPCGSGEPYACCCGPLLAGERAAATAEALMRSRYTAFVRGDMGYLEKTLIARRRAQFHPRQAQAWNADVVWTGLTLLAMRDGGPGDETGVVEFVAAYVKGGEPGSLHERSRFKKQAGHWFYVDGRAGVTAQTAAAASKVGRNDPCPCGSGKKYKHCCG